MSEYRSIGVSAKHPLQATTSTSNPDTPTPRYPVTVFLILLSSLLYILAFPNFGIAPLAWLALIPLTWVALEERPARSFGFGWLAGTLSHLGILSWLITTCRAASVSVGFSFLCLLLLSAYLGIYWGAWTWLISAWGEGVNSFRFPLFAASAWVFLEYARTYLLSGFPWALLGETQWRNLPLIQMASVTGIYGVSFIVALANVTAAQLIHTGLKHFPSLRTGLASVATSLLLLTTYYAYGAYRIRAYSAEPPAARSLTVALLQGNIDQYKKWDQAYVDEIEQTYSRLIQSAARDHPELVVWPETSVPGYLLQDPSLRAWLDHAIAATQADSLVGAPSQESQDIAYNAAFVLNARGEVRGEYDKQHLVPFGEIIPWGPVLRRWIHVLNQLGGFTAGVRSPVLAAAGTSVGVNICYEAIFPNGVRRAVLRGARLIANLTNDGWYLRTAEPLQHFIPNVFRAVENNRWVLRADNTGITGLINPVGNVEQASPIFQSRVITGRVEPRDALTLYTRFGDVFAWLCGVFCVGNMLLAILRP